MNTHGAHPNSDVNTILWDKAENRTTGSDDGLSRATLLTTRW
jgi:hypothetical protein